MILFPNAKINIGLNIIERRPDGYHNIETIMYPIDWCDILEIVPSNGLETTLTVTGRKVNCPAEQNLVMKAFRLFQEETNIGNVDIYLRKIIPDGAGLGGGSSDAAFTLIGLNEIFNCNLPAEKLADMAAKIGADCPFFIYNKPQLATGTGTTLSDINVDLSGYTIVLVKPPVSVPTSKAYAGVTPAKPDYDLIESVTLPASQWFKYIKNDFESSIFTEYPKIADIKDKLVSTGAVYSAMSGSGSSVYALYSKSDILSENILKLFPDCDTYAGVL